MVVEIYNWRTRVAVASLDADGKVTVEPAGARKLLERLKVPVFADPARSPVALVTIADGAAFLAALPFYTWLRANPYFRARLVEGADHLTGRELRRLARALRGPMERLPVSASSLDRRLARLPADVRALLFEAFARKPRPAQLALFDLPASTRANERPTSPRTPGLRRS